ncbi:hypothetical protein HBI81_256460 [Parastagonospora nodorum]|nr:hypothetical protein HBI18_241200 [Parastagonospora nodorum]KAH6510782.1 hypothetical protein HBI81_256460 [Parastagonospora nodorum]
MAPSTAPAPPSNPWAFANAYQSALPAEFDFDPHTGFTDLSSRIDIAGQGRLASTYPRVNPIIATYRDGNHKKSFTSMGNLSPAEQAEYASGATIS